MNIVDAEQLDINQRIALRLGEPGGPPAPVALGVPARAPESGCRG